MNCKDQALINKYAKIVRYLSCDASISVMSEILLIIKQIYELSFYDWRYQVSMWP